VLVNDIEWLTVRCTIECQGEILELSQQYIRVKLMSSYEYADQSQELGRL